VVLSPFWRRLTLSVHIGASVGWLGGVAAFVALGVIGLTHPDPATVRGAYLVMEPAAYLVLLPLAGASLVSGILSSLTSIWGLFRHYWVLFKLVINLVATLVLISYLDSFAAMARLAADPSTALTTLRNPSPLLHAVLAMLVLSVAVVLAVFKPRGLTRWGLRKPAADPSAGA
jgi:hypothetical protein